MAQIREELILYDSFTNTFTKYIQYGQQAASVTNTAKKATSEFTQSQRTASNATGGLTQSIKGLVGAYAGLQGIRKLLDLSGTISSTTARLDMMNDGLQTTEELNQMIFESTQRSRGAYLDTANFVAKLGNLAGDAFSSNREIIDFAEQINKQITLSGASSTEASAAIYQLTQALSAGALRGEELNSVMEQTPMIAKTIADYMGVTTGEMRELASEGKITADVVKNAMFAAAEETNAAFEKMPMTWGQVWTQFQNIAIQALQPLLGIIGQFAGFVSENLNTIIPVVLALAAAWGVYTAAQWIATGAAKAFFATLLSSPLTWILVVVGLIVTAIAQWVQAIGGLEIAWLTVVDNVLYWWDFLKAGFMTGVYFILDLWDQFMLKVQQVSVGIQNFIGSMRVGVLQILQNMVNGAIDIINGFISALNHIPFVSIDLIEKATFATTAAAEEEAARQAREAQLTAAQQETAQRQAQRANGLANMWAERDANHAARQAEIAQKRAEQASAATTSTAGATEVNDPQLEETNNTLKGINKSVSASQEDLQSLVDVAERRYVNNINLTAQTPVITINGANTGHTAADRQNLANTIRDILVEQVAASSVRTTARAF